MENNPDWFAEFFTSLEIAGELGLDQPIAAELNQEDIEQNIVEAIRELRPEVEGSSEQTELLQLYSQFIESILPDDIDTKNGGSNRFGIEDIDYPAPLFLRMGLSFPQEIQLTLDRLSNTNFRQLTLEFGRSLKQQGVLENTTEVCMYSFLQNRSYSKSYMNELFNTVTENIDRLRDLETSEDIDEKELKELYLESCRYFEYASPQAIVIVSYLEEEEIEFEDVAGMSLSNSLEKIQSIDYFNKLAKSIDPHIRNAIAHGGPNGGVDYNPIEETITFRYSLGDDVQEKQLLVSEFKCQVMTAMSAAITLYLLPSFLFFQTMHTKFEEAFSC